MARDELAATITTVWLAEARSRRQPPMPGVMAQIPCQTAAGAHQQWLDHASAQALGCAARRLAADPVGLVFAARVRGKDVAGLPELVVEGLAEDDAREPLASVLTGPLDARSGTRSSPTRTGTRWHCWSCRES